MSAPPPSGQADKKAGEDLEAAVSVGVILVGGAGGDGEAEEDEAGARTSAADSSPSATTAWSVRRCRRGF